MPANPRSAHRSVPVFAALGDETRLHLVEKLSAEGSLSVTRLTEDTALTRQAITKHLRVLEGAGLVTGAKHGRELQFTLVHDRLAQAREDLAALSAQWDDAIQRLRAFVES